MGTDGFKRGEGILGKWHSKKKKKRWGGKVNKEMVTSLKKTRGEKEGRRERVWWQEALVNPLEMGEKKSGGGGRALGSSWGKKGGLGGEVCAKKKTLRREEGLKEGGGFRKSWLRGTGKKLPKGVYEKRRTKGKRWRDRKEGTEEKGEKTVSSKIGRGEGCRGGELTGRFKKKKGKT